MYKRHKALTVVIMKISVYWWYREVRYTVTEIRKERTDTIFMVEVTL
jgi:hypothetical protein